MRLEHSKWKQRQISTKNYFKNGILLFCLGISYFFIYHYMYVTKETHHIKGYLVYLVAFMAFYSLGAAIYGMIKYHRKNDPILIAIKNTNCANALTSIVLTQVVLLENFGEKLDYSKTNGMMGMAISLIIMLIGIKMVIDITKEKTLGH